MSETSEVKKEKAKLSVKDRLAQHTYRSDGVVESAIRGFVCFKCHKTVAEITECVDGDKCEQKNMMRGVYGP